MWLLPIGVACSVESFRRPLQRLRFGARSGRHALVAELERRRQAGVHHLGLQLRRNARPLDETLHGLAQHVLPRFHAEQAAPHAVIA